MLTGDIIAAVEAVAPRSWQEDWDNTGLQVGTPRTECTGVLVCVDVTPEVVDEAIERKCNLIVSHHPLIFKGLKSLTGRTPVEAAVMNAIAAGVSVYSSHTALDNAPGGVSYTMAEKLGARVLGALSPMKPKWYKLGVMVPVTAAESVRMAMFDAGAGTVAPGGKYDCCSFNTDGTGTFEAQPGAHPYVGKVGELHTEAEVKVEVMVPYPALSRVLENMRQTHPYECPAYELLQPLNPDPAIGLGVTAVLDERMKPAQFIDHVLKTFGARVARCSDYTRAMDADTLISRVAMCGGSGGEFIGDAVAAGAQAYITGDVRYHDFVDRQNDILIIDIGHYETEECAKDIFYRIITDKFAGLTVYKSEVGTNPVHYYGETEN